MEWIGSTITAIINAGWKIYLAALIASAALLYLPEARIAQLGLEEFRQTYRSDAGIVFIVSVSLLGTSLISVVWDILLTPWRKWKFDRMILTTLSELTVDEKMFLIPFISPGQNTQYAEMYDGIAKGLEAKKILYRSSNVSAPGGAFPYNMQPYARKMLADRPDLLLP